MTEKLPRVSEFKFNKYKNLDKRNENRKSQSFQTKSKRRKETVVMTTM